MESRDIRARLDQLGSEIEARIRRLQEQGVTEGAAREAAAELRQRQQRLAEAAQTGGHAVSEIEHDLNALRTSFQHWLARIDADYARYK